jgi:hypothetical protein
MKIIAKTLQKEKIDISVDGETVGDLRQSIIIAKNVPTDKYVKIIFSGKILEDDTEKMTNAGLEDSKEIVIIITQIKKPIVKSIVEPVISVTAPTTPTTPIAPPVAPPIIPTTESSDPINLFDLPQNESSFVDPLNIQGLNDTPGLDGSVGLNPQASAFGQLLMQNPQMIMQLLMQDPTIQQLSQENPQAVQDLLTNPNLLQQLMNVVPGGSSNDTGGPLIPGAIPGTQVIQLTEDEKLEIDQLVGLGVNFQEALYYYESCGRDVNAAANLIFQDIVQQIPDADHNNGE